MKPEEDEKRIKAGDYVEIIEKTKTLAAGGCHNVKYTNLVATDIDYYGKSVTVDTDNIRLSQQSSDIRHVELPNDQALEEKNERHYLNGERFVYNEMIQTALSGLMYPKDMKIEVLIVERERIIKALRSLCEDFGDNDWNEHLSLPDVIEKNLGNHLRRNEQE